MGNFKMALDYIDVATRIVEFREKHPEGSLQQVTLDFREVNGAWWVVYTAAAYRTPEDQRPGMGTAWEPVPGKTPYTRDSELQNAETAAWGRAIVAALAADTRKGVASAEEVRNRQDDAEGSQDRPVGRQRQTRTPDINALKAQIAAHFPGKKPTEIRQTITDSLGKAPEEWTVEDLSTFLTSLTEGEAA